MADRLRATARRLPDKTAVVVGVQRLTYAQADAAADRAAAALAAGGLQAGDRVALLLGNGTAFVEALYGAWRAGLVAVPVNTAFTPDEVAAILDDSGARAVLVDPSVADTVAALRGSLPQVDTVFIDGDPAAGGGMSGWRVALEAAPERPPVDLTGDPDGLALLQYTSGTTGEPRGAMLRHAHLLANHDQLRRSRLTLHKQDVTFCVLPLFHIYGLNVALGFTLAAGATLLLEDRFDPLASLRLIAEERASVVVAAPPAYVAWLAAPGAAGLDLSSVRLAVSGAAALPAEVLQATKAVLGWDVWEGYGLTETAPVLTSSAMRPAPRPGFVGPPLPGVELRVIDERGTTLADGEVGEVLARGRNVFAGYWQQPEATAAVLDADGWFATGDIGYLDGGDLCVVDRKRDLVVVNGFNVYPAEVEAVLERHPAVARAAVVGEPHPATGEAVKAYVVLEAGASATGAELIGLARQHLARFKCPQAVVFADALPLLPTGKVRRRLLRG